MLEAIMGGTRERWWQPVTTAKFAIAAIPAPKDESPIAVCGFRAENGWTNICLKARLTAPKTNNIGR
jgi:hypothetical protein